jgi:hypothetical protein
MMMRFQTQTHWHNNLAERDETLGPKTIADLIERTLSQALPGIS